MSSKGSQRVNATANYDKQDVANRYREIKEIIIENSQIPFKVVIENIAGISAGTYYNYIYPGKRMGQVSQYTINNLSNYFSDVPKELFTTQAELDNESKVKIAKRIHDDFTNDFEKEQSYRKSINSNKNHRDILEKIKSIVKDLNNENNIEELQKSLKLLELSLEIANNRIESLMKITEL